MGGGVRSKILNQVVLASNVMFHINGKHSDRSARCLYTVTGRRCPVSVAWHSSVEAQTLKYHCYKQALSRNDLRCLKATLSPNKHICSHYLCIIGLSHYSDYGLYVFQTTLCVIGLLYILKVLYHRRGCKNSF